MSHGLMRGETGGLANETYLSNPSLFDGFGNVHPRNNF